MLLYEMKCLFAGSRFPTCAAVLDYPHHKLPRDAHAVSDVVDVDVFVVGGERAAGHSDVVWLWWVTL